MARANGESSPEIDQSELEVLLEFYGRIREEIISESEMYNKRITRGLAVIAAVWGYGLFRDSEWIIAISPVILGFIFIQTAQSTRIVASSAHQLIDIEAKLQNTSELVKWETKYGGYYGSLTTNKGKLFHPYRLPGYINGVVGISVYFILVVFSITYWKTRPSSLAWVETAHLAILYTLFTFMVAIAGWISYRYYKNLRPSESIAIES